MLKIKILSEKKAYPTKLSVFDFDGTLFKSPDKPEGYKGNWWLEEKSLSYPNVSKKPGDNFWNADVVEAAKKELSNPSSYCIMLTGRIDNVFNDRIKELLGQKSLRFQEVGLNSYGGDTGNFKINKIKQILKKYPSIKEIEMWEDEPDKIELYTGEFSGDYDFKINDLGKGKLEEAPHVFISEMSDEFIKDLRDEFFESLTDKEIFNLLTDNVQGDGVVDFMTEKHKIHGRDFYVTLKDKIYLINNFGEIKKVDSKKENIPTLPKNWVKHYFERLKK